MTGWHYDPPEPDVNYHGGFTHEDCPDKDSTVDVQIETRDHLRVVCSCGAVLEQEREI